MELDTPGLRLLTRYHLFLPALLLCALGSWLADYFGASVIYFSHALFGWGAFVAMRSGTAKSPAEAALRRLPATLLLLIGFGLVGGLLLGVPAALAVSQPGWLSGGLLVTCILIFFGGGVRFWPAPALLFVVPAGQLGDGAFERAARATRLALSLTRGHLDRTLEGAPLFTSLGLLVIVPFVLVLARQGPGSPGYWAIMGVAFAVVAPLIHALLLDEVSQLLSEVQPGAEPDRPPAPQETPETLVGLAQQGTLEELRELHQAGVPIDADRDGVTPLMAAARAPKNALAIVSYLLDAGASTDSVDPRGRNAMHYAAAYADTAVVERLLAAGVDLDAPDSEQHTPLGVACSQGRWMNASALIEAGAAVTGKGVAPLHLAAVADGDDPAGVDILIAHGASVDARGKLGRTALLGAAMSGNALVARALLRSGADINAQDDFGNTALMEAARAGANAVLEELSHWNPDTEPRDKPGRTALLVAVSSRRSNEETIRLLLAMGADPEVENREGRGAGELAVSAGRWRIARALGVEARTAPAEARVVAADENDPEAQRVIDLKVFETEDDTAWAARQFQQRSRTQLDAATIAEAERPAAAGAEEPPTDEVPAEAEAEPEAMEAEAPEETEAVSFDQEEAERKLDSVVEIDVEPGVSLPEQAELPIEVPDATAPGDERDTERAGYQTILRAARRDDLEQMQVVLEHETEIPDWWLSSAFLNGVAAGRAVAPRWLLDHGLNPNAKSEGGEPLLSCIAQQSPPNLEILEALVEKGARADADPLLLHWICGKAEHQHDHSEPLDPEEEARCTVLVRSLLENGADCLAEDEAGNQPLHWAVRYRNAATVETLLAGGSPVDPVNQRGATPLIMAVTEGRTGIARVLVKAGADPKLANEKGNSAMSIAMERQDQTLTKLLMSGRQSAPAEPADENDPEQLIEAAAAGNLGRVKRLLSRGIDIDHRDQQGCTALLRAAGEGHADVVSALLHAGADPGIPARNKTTPLGAAVLAGHLETAKLLCDRGVPADQRQQHGITPLMLAAARWQPRMVVALLGYDADPQARDETEGTPLMAAVQNALHAGDLEAGIGTIKLLLKAGADVNAANDEGQTPLMLLLGVRARAGEAASESHLVRLAEMLIEAGADVDRQDFAGWSALHAAAGHGFRDAARLLMEAGASRRVRDINGLSPVDLAMDNAHDELVDLFVNASS